MVGSQWKIFSSAGMCLEKLLCGQDELDLRDPEGWEPSGRARRHEEARTKKGHKDGEKGIRARKTKLRDPLYLKDERKEKSSANGRPQLPNTGPPCPQSPSHAYCKDREPPLSFP